MHGPWKCSMGKKQVPKDNILNVFIYIIRDMATQTETDWLMLGYKGQARVIARA